MCVRASASMPSEATSEFTCYLSLEHCQHAAGHSLQLTECMLQVVEGFDAQQLAALLKFVTSCSRPPLGGFQFLVPPFTIHQVTSSFWR